MKSPTSFDSCDQRIIFRSLTFAELLIESLTLPVAWKRLVSSLHPRMSRPLVTEVSPRVWMTGTTCFPMAPLAVSHNRLEEMNPH